MPLVYRSILHDEGDDLGRSVAELFLGWLDSKGIKIEGAQIGSRLGTSLVDGEGHAVRVQRRGVALPAKRGTTPARAERFRLVEDRGAGRWSTTVTVFTPPPRQDALFLTGQKETAAQQHLFEDPRTASGCWAWIDLEYEPAEPGEIVRPGSPRLVRDLMAAGDINDAGVPLTAETLRITAAHVPELAAHIRSDKRHVPVMVFAFDQQRSYDRDRLARNLARDLAGVAAVFLLEDAEATAALARALPEGFAVYGGALRTYLPGAGGDGDEPLRHRVLGRTSIAAMRARAFPAVRDHVLRLSTQRPTPPEADTIRRLLADLDPVPAEPAATGEVSPASSVLRWINLQILRIRLALGGELASPPTSFSTAQALLETELDQLLAAPRAAERLPQQQPPADLIEVKALSEQLVKAAEERQVYETLLSEADRETTSLRSGLDEERLTREYFELELAEGAREDADLRRRLAYLERLERERGQQHVDDPDAIPVPDSVADAVVACRTHLSHVVLGPLDEIAAELDVHTGAELYAAKTWSALQALNDYAAARSSGSFTGSFFHWCQNSEAGAWGISAASLAMGESESVNSNPDLRSKRIFPVPTQVDPSGQAFMGAHIKIVRRGTPCPRLHFLDDAGGSTGKVYVGYIGDHLPTARFK